MSDIPHDETDNELEKLEKKIKRYYKQSVKEMKQKVKEQTEKYEKDRKWWIQQIKDGKKTQEEFEMWLRVKAMERERVQSIVSTLSTDLRNSRDLAYSAINHHIPEVYAINANGSAYQIEKDIQMDMSFTLYDRQTVEKLIRDNPKLLPKGKPPENAQKWSQAKLRNELTQGILQGESNQNIAKRLERVFGMDMVSSIRNARTMTTYAECAGRLDTYAKAKSLGLEMQKEWRATLDSRTRHEHRLLDGQKQDIDEPFDVEGYKLMCPADPAGEPFLVYNCRCTMVHAIKGIEHDDIRQVSKEYKDYNDWKYAKSKNKPYFGNESKVPLPSEPIEVVSNVPPIEEWVDLCKQNTESEMLAWEKVYFSILSKNESSAIKTYTGSSYMWMNGYLRDIAGGMSKQEANKKYRIDEWKQQTIDYTISGMSNMYNDRDMVVRRGTDFGDLAGLFMSGNFDDNYNSLYDLYDEKGIEGLRELFVGEYGEYAGFTSTSSLWNRGFHGDVEIVFFLPEGVNAMSVMQISQFGTSEGETLLNAGTKVQCVGIEKSDGHKGSDIRVFLRVIKEEVIYEGY